MSAKNDFSKNRLSKTIVCSNNSTKLSLDTIEISKFCWNSLKIVLFFFQLNSISLNENVLKIDLYF